MHSRDDRQMKAFTGLSQAHFNSLLPVFRDVYQATQQQAYEAGVESGTRRRKPGGGAKGTLPTVAEKLLFVLSYYKTYPTFDVLGAQFEMGRSKANENLHKLSPILYDTLGDLALMPSRELGTPEALKAALQGGEPVLIDATERASRRSQDDAKPREHYSGKNTAYAQAYRHIPPREGDHLSGADV
jgi:Helix-turn-helix of DDE superfamily endonuclease